MTDRMMGEAGYHQLLWIVELAERLGEQCEQFVEHHTFECGSCPLCRWLDKYTHGKAYHVDDVKVLGLTAATLARLIGSNLPGKTWRSERAKKK
jgi:hypothetical protein